MFDRCELLVDRRGQSHCRLSAKYSHLRYSIIPFNSQIGPVNPGLLTYRYKDIKTHVFGISNLPVGLFGLLKGRVNYIDTVWFDGERWIERNYLENGDVVYSVYVRDMEDEKEQTM